MNLESKKLLTRKPCDADDKGFISPDVAKMDTEILEVEQDQQEGGSSRRSSISSCSEGVLNEKMDRIGRKKRKIVGTEIENEQYDIMKEVRETDELVEYLQNRRQELEKFLFAESNKISRPAIKTILGFWSEMETKLTDLMVKQSRLEGMLTERKTAMHVEKNLVESYAEKTRGSKAEFKLKERPKRNSNNVVIIKTMDREEPISNEVLKEKALKIIKEKRRDIRISNTRMTRDNGLLVEAESKEDITAMKLMKFNQEGLKIESPRRVGPNIIIFDVEKCKTEEDIREDLWSKNLMRDGLTRTEYDNRIIFRFQTRNKNPKLVNWVIEVPPLVYDILLDRGRAFVEWKAYKVKEYFNVSRCFKCLGYGHTSKKCSSEVLYCGHCGDQGHIFKECQKREEKPRCICCIRNKRPSVEHSCRDKGCPEYVRQLERYKARITYTE